MNRMIAVLALLSVSPVAPVRGRHAATPAPAPSPMFHSGALAYDCSSLPDLQNPKAVSADPDPLVASLGALLMGDQDEAWVRRARGAVAAIERTDSASLTLEQRVAIQNLLFRVASSLARDDDPQMAPLRRRAVAQVQALAIEARELDALGYEPSSVVERWLGPRSQWFERSTEFCGAGDLLLHDRIFGGALAFRPVRTTTSRGLIAQLVAFDRDGNAHVTPFVERVEMRRSLDVDAPVCVAHAALASGEVEPHALDLEAIGVRHRGDPFVFRMGEGVGCASCHSSTTAFAVADVPDAPAARTLLDARRGRVLELATRRLAELGR